MKIYQLKAVHDSKNLKTNVNNNYSYPEFFIIINIPAAIQQTKNIL